MVKIATTKSLWPGKSPLLKGLDALVDQLDRLVDATLADIVTSRHATRRIPPVSILEQRPAWVGMELHLVALRMYLLCDWPHWVVLEMVTVKRFDEERRLDIVLTEGIQHETQAMRPPLNIAPYKRLGNRLPRLVRKSATDTEFGVDCDTDAGTY